MGGHGMKHSYAFSRASLQLREASQQLSGCCCKIVTHHSKLDFQSSEQARIGNSVLLGVDLKLSHLLLGRELWGETPSLQGCLSLCAAIQGCRTNLQKSKENLIVQWSWIIKSIACWTTVVFLNFFSCLQFFLGGYVLRTLCSQEKWC